MDGRTMFSGLPRYLYKEKEKLDFFASFTSLSR